MEDEIKITKDEQLYTVKEICELFKITRKTLNNWMKKGFPHYKIFNGSVRFNKEEIKSWLQEQKIGGDSNGET